VGRNQHKRASSVANDTFFSRTDFSATVSEQDTVLGAVMDSHARRALGLHAHAKHVFMGNENENGRCGELNWKGSAGQ
jgi:hypothetical protein